MTEIGNILAMAHYPVQTPSDEARRRLYLGRMGIDVWMPRDAVQPGSATDDAPARPETSRADDKAMGTVQSAADSPVPVDALDWEALEARVAHCQGCPLCETRTQTVFGVGNRQADLLVVGEAPGAEEDRQGEPFVGRAGKLLDNMLFAMGRPRPEVFIANILKCRPPNNRDPLPEEVAECEPYLLRQIALLRPRVILAVGRVAAQNLLKTDRPLSALRGRAHRYGEADTPVVITYHPAYLLRSPRDKAKAWADLRLAMGLLAER